MLGRTSSYRAYFAGEIQGRTSQSHMARQSCGQSLTRIDTGRQSWQPDTYPLRGKLAIAIATRTAETLSAR